MKNFLNQLLPAARAPPQHTCVSERAQNNTTYDMNKKELSMFNNDFMILRVGEKIPSLSGFDGCVVDWLSGTVSYCIVLGDPDVSLQNKVIGSLEKKIRLAKYTSGNILDLAIKLEGLPWMDAPYTPHLSAVENLPRKDGYPEGMGAMMNILVVDGTDGTILHIKTIALSNRFSTDLAKDIWSLKKMPFNRLSYNREVLELQRKYEPNVIGEKLKQSSFVTH